MEHLPLPQDPIEPHQKIKLRTYEPIPTAGPFLTYRQRYWHLLEPTPHVPTQTELRGNPAALGGVSNLQILEFYQGWLFFCLIEEFLGAHYVAENYLLLGQDDTGTTTGEFDFLSTRDLHKDIEAWRTKGKLSAIAAGDEYHKHLKACLDVVEDVFIEIESLYPGFTKHHPEDMICFAALAEAFDCAIATALENGPVGFFGEELPSDWREYPDPAKRHWLSKVESLMSLDQGETRNRMVKAGWCPGNISRVCDSFSSVASYYYFSRFKVDTASNGSHKGCPSFGCMVSASAEPKHREHGCSCPGMINFPEEVLIESYEKGHVPCFSLGKSEDGKFAIAMTSCAIDQESQKDPDNHFIALSHVWTEGMGNPKVNSLPFCRLAHVQYWGMLAYQAAEEKLAGKSEINPGVTIQDTPKIRQINIWIDTMCCPATPGYGKNLCLAMMREIYTTAYAVLVYSTALESTNLRDKVEAMRSSKDGLVDLAAQIFLSPWMRRMWTLQEGVLAGISKGRGVGDRLFFSFADGLFSLESVVNLLKKASKSEAMFAFDFIGKFAQLSPMMWNYSKGSDSRSFSVSFFLRMLSSSLKYRSLSVASDEAICLATLLGLRIRNTQGEVPLIGNGKVPDAGMCEFWRLIEAHYSGLPADIIFSSVPRVRAPGFGWAPRTLVQHARYGELFLSGSEQEPARITEKGLEVRFRGASLRPLDPASRKGNYLFPEIVNKSPEHTSDGEDLFKETTSNLIMLVQIPVDSGIWYAVAKSSLQDDPLYEVVDPEMASFPTDLHSIVHEGSVVLLFRDIGTRGPGLFVTTCPEPGHSGLPTSNTKHIQVTSKLPVLITRLASSGCIIASAAQECINHLEVAVNAQVEQRGDVAAVDVWLEHDTVKSLLRETANGMVMSSNELRDALYQEELVRKASTTDEKALQRFIRNTNQLARYGGIGGEMYAEEQLWCVD